MQEGFLLDRTRHSLEQQDWVEGKPQLPFGSTSIDISGATQYRVATWRCPTCGTLESRAIERLTE